MKKMNFKWLVVLCIAMGLVNVAKAQIYSNEACFYAKAGSSSVSYAVKFDYSKNQVWLKGVANGTVRSNLAKSIDFYENDEWTEKQNDTHPYEYDSQKSTSTREVYKRKDTRGTNTVRNSGGFNVSNSYVKGYRYVAFSPDMSSFIMWFEDDNNYNGDIKEKRDYTRIPKEDLLPKAANYDFLND